MIDLHMHTQFSDGKDIHSDHIQVAKQKGITIMGFADHICLKDVKWALPLDKVNQMTTILDQLKKQTKELKLLYGVEFDYFPDREKELSQLINSLPIDYAIGSVHFIGDWNYDTSREGYTNWDIDALYHRYFEIVKQAAQSGLFDVLAHLDLIKKFEIWPSSDMESLYREVVKVIAKSDVAVELNTSGVDRPCGEFFPNDQILKLLCEYNVPISMGSDAHRKEQVGRYFDEGLNLLNKIGFNEIVYFEKRERKSIEIKKILEKRDKNEIFSV